MAFTKTELLRVDKDVIAGLGQLSLMFDWSKVTSWPVFPTLEALKSSVNNNTYKDLAKVTGDIALASGEFMERVYCTLNKGKTKTSGAGQIDQNGFISEIELVFPGNTEEVLGFVKYWQSRDICILLSELDMLATEYRLYGHPLRPVKIKSIEIENNAEIKDAKMAKIVLDYSLDIPMTYSGAITADLRPVITSFAPGAGAVAASITVTGRNFTGATAVKIGTRTATPTVINDWTLTFAIPASSVSNKISIVNASGESALSAATLTVS